MLVLCYQFILLFLLFARIRSLHEVDQRTVNLNFWQFHVPFIANKQPTNKPASYAIVDNVELRLRRWIMLFSINYIAFFSLVRLVWSVRFGRCGCGWQTATFSYYYLCHCVFYKIHRRMVARYEPNYTV